MLIVAGPECSAVVSVLVIRQLARAELGADARSCGEREQELRRVAVWHDLCLRNALQAFKENHSLRCISLKTFFTGRG